MLSDYETQSNVSLIPQQRQKLRLLLQNSVFEQARPRLCQVSVPFSHEELSRFSNMQSNVRMGFQKR